MVEPQVRIRNLNPFPASLPRYQKLATVSVVDPLDVREQMGLLLKEVGPGVVEMGVQQMSTTEAEE